MPALPGSSELPVMQTWLTVLLTLLAAQCLHLALPLRGAYTAWRLPGGLLLWLAWLAWCQLLPWLTASLVYGLLLMCCWVSLPWLHLVRRRVL